jgi:hypothetical protein
MRSAVVDSGLASHDRRDALDGMSWAGLPFLRDMVADWKWRQRWEVAMKGRCRCCLEELESGN